jgi:hypothetical protein
MSDLGFHPLSPDGVRLAGASDEQRRAMLKQAVDEVVGVTFFGEMLRIARNNPLKSTIGHGGHGEDVFKPQLDMEFARRMGHSVRSGLSDALYNRLARRI